MGAIAAELVDSGEKQDARGRRVFARAQRMALIAAYRASGMTMAAFARRETINYSTFAGWMAKAGQVPAPKSTIQFAEVQMPPAAARARPMAALEVQLADGTVLRGPSVAELVSLVRALRS